MIAAAGGAGYWSLVVQSLVGDGLLLVCLLALQGLPRFGLQLARLRSIFRFSIAVPPGANCLMFVGQKRGHHVIGFVLGSTALAYYALAYRIQRFPLQFIGSAINDVALPIFSRLQQDPGRRESWFFTATRFIVLLTWPTLVILAVSADVAIPFLFGPDWRRRHRSPAAPVARRPVDDLSVDVPTTADLQRAHRRRVRLVARDREPARRSLRHRRAVGRERGRREPRHRRPHARRAAVSARVTSDALLLASLRRQPSPGGHRVRRPRYSCGVVSPVWSGTQSEPPAPSSRPRWLPVRSTWAPSAAMWPGVVADTRAGPHPVS